MTSGGKANGPQSNSLTRMVIILSFMFIYGRLVEINNNVIVIVSVLIRRGGYLNNPTQFLARLNTLVVMCLSFFVYLYFNANFRATLLSSFSKEKKSQTAGTKSSKQKTARSML